MQFGYVNILEQPLEMAYADLVDNLREQAVFCDQAGWDHLWLGEHHFGVSGRDNTPNPFMLACDLGARTKRLRLGIAVVVLPLWHPLRAAENIALMDQMLRGRVEIGFGRASQPHEVVTFNPAADPRNESGSREVFAESLEIVRTACTEKFFSFHGKHYELPPAGVVNGFAITQLFGEQWRVIEASICVQWSQNGGSFSFQRSACRSSVAW